MAVRLFFLLKVLSWLAMVSASPIGCSIRHKLPIVSDRQPFPSLYNIVRDRTREQQQSSETRYEDVCIIASLTTGYLSIRRTFPAHRTIELFYPMIPFFGPNLFARFNATTVSLELRKGAISELYFGSANHLQSLKISDIGLSTFNVVPEPNAMLRALVIHDRNLTTITPNIRYLEELQLLDLSGCSLTVFSLDVLVPMRWLTALNLAENELMLIDTGDDLVLPELLMFDVEQNDLQEIDRFPEVFPGLKFTRLIQNDWKCEWVGRARSTIWTSNITVLGSDFFCGTRPNNGGLCCTPAERTEERIAITKAMLSVLADLEPASVSSMPNGVDSSTETPLLTVKVFENDTIDGVIGVEMQNVGIYLQEPVRVA
uniref:Putative secreted protein n=2 Tax=Anopheles marajoara TaxID=58244 RepID=A0A2M4BRH5_9DIPT